MTPLDVAFAPVPWSHLGAAFLLSLLGGLHCAAMCGGFVGALHGSVAVPGTASRAARRLVGGYHIGRLSSYMLAGAIAGLAGGSLFASRVLPLQVALLIAGSLMLFVIAASMFGRNAWLKRLEPAGVFVWRRVAPVARRLYPPRTPAQSLAAGIAWGWIPCGMVYAALPLALTSGSPLGGAMVMLAFGLGTLPNLLGIELLIARTRKLGENRAGTPPTSARALRVAAGAALVVFGLSGLAHAAQVAGARHPAIVAFAGLCHR